MDNQNNNEEIIIQFPPIKEKTPRKIWLVGLAQKGDLEDLKETVEDIAAKFTGLVYTYSGKITDKEYILLNSLKGEGEIICINWPKRFDLARNIFMNCGPIDAGDWCLQKDGLEKIQKSFLDIKLEILLDFLEEQKCDAIYICGKIFGFKFNDELEYIGGCHETLSNLTKGVELTKMPSFENKDDYFINLRPQKRDKFEFVSHYLTYYLLRSSARHCLHGLSSNYTDPKEIQEKWFERETRRRDFKDYLRILKISLDFSSFLSYLKKNKEKLPPKMLRFLNSEKILNDVWRYGVENRTDFEDDQNQLNLIEIKND